MEYHHAALGFNEETRKNFIQRLLNNGFNSHMIYLGVGEELQMLYFWR